MKRTVNDMLAELALAKLDGVEYVNYVDVIAVPIVEAIKDIAAIGESDQMGDYSWTACDANGDAV